MSRAKSNDVPQWEAEGKAQGAKPRKKPGCLAILVIIVVAIIAIASIGTAINNHAKQAEYDNQTFEWPTSGLATLLPEPSTDKGAINSNSDTYLYVELRGCNESDYTDYLEQCKMAGFTIEPSTTSTSYYAYDEDGNRLGLALYTSNSELSITLDKAEELDELAWPTTGLAANLPAPSSSTGKVTTDSSKSWKATVGQTDMDAYKAYVDEVFAAGFDQNYDKGDKLFKADNLDGLHVEIYYAGANTMTVSIEEVELTSETASDSNDEEATTGSAADTSRTAAASSNDESADSAKISSNDTVQSLADAGGKLLSGAVDAAANALVTPEFKEMMDGYETFMNHYVELGKKAQANPSDTALLSEYTGLLQDELDWLAKIDAVDQDSLSAADTAYYLAVTGRVVAKLSELQ